MTKDGYNTRYYEETDALLVWENIQPELKKCFKYYNTATANLATLYKEVINKGVYANDFADSTVTAVSEYMNYFYEK